MNLSIIRYVVGCILKFQSLFLLLPCLTALLYGERVGWMYLAVSGGCLAAGQLLSCKKPKNQVFYLKEGCVATSLSWMILSLSGALPFFLGGEIPSFLDAVFETVSGFSTTGSSVLDNVEELSHASSLWRCFTNWVGGMGVLVFLLAVLPLSGGSHMNLMRAESPGPSVGKLAPRLRYTARILYLIYMGLSVAQLLLLLLGKMPLYDAICTVFSTAGTGGFGVKNSGMAGYSPYIQWVITIFMLIFGVNFNVYYLILVQDIKKALQLEELRWYLGIISAAVLLIFLDLAQTSYSAFEALTHSAFQVVSLITTTGFATADFNLWGESSRIILIFLMLSGGCAGSTSGGIKVSRIAILFKTMRKEFKSYLHPKSITKIMMDGKEVEHGVIRSVNAFFITYTVILFSSVLLLSVEGKGMVTSFTSAVSALSNVGPGLDLSGPMQNFGHFSHFSKLTLIVDMLAGRLELFPLIMLFHPGIWKDAARRG